MGQAPDATGHSALAADRWIGVPSGTPYATAAECFRGGDDLCRYKSSVEVTRAFWDAFPHPVPERTGDRDPDAISESETEPDAAGMRDLDEHRSGLHDAGDANTRRGYLHQHDAEGRDVRAALAAAAIADTVDAVSRAAGRPVSLDRWLRAMADSNADVCEPVT